MVRPMSSIGRQYIYVSRTWPERKGQIVTVLAVPDPDTRASGQGWRLRVLGSAEGYAAAESV